MVKESVSVKAPGTWSPFDICLLVDSLEDHVDTLDHGAKMILAG